MEPQTLVILDHLAAYGPWAIVLGLFIMNLHRFTDAYDAASATRLRNRAAAQALNCEVSEAQRDRALIVFNGMARPSRSNGIEVPSGGAPTATSEVFTKARTKAVARPSRPKPS
jgi:hypothetical protein